MQEEALVIEKSSVVSVRKTLFLACKRTFDIFCSLIGLIMLLPVFLIVSIIIKIDSRGPVFLVQKRIGRNDSQIEWIFGTPNYRSDLRRTVGRCDCFDWISGSYFLIFCIHNLIEWILYCSGLCFLHKPEQFYFIKRVLALFILFSFPEIWFWRYWLLVNQGI